MVYSAYRQFFQLTGDFVGERADELGPLVLNGTRFLPELNGKRWSPSQEGKGDGIGPSLQIDIKRARIRVEILKSSSDVSAKFELFQRLNTGGAALTEQEVRNSIAVSVNPQFYDWLLECATLEGFVRTTDQTQQGLEFQSGVELALRFFAFRTVQYNSGLDVHEYLDQAMMKIALDTDYDRNNEGRIFKSTFNYLDGALGRQAFKRWDGQAFSGNF